MQKKANNREKEYTGLQLMGKKILFFLLILFFLSNYCYSQDFLNKYEFTIKDFSLVYNNHVGNEWVYAVNITLDGFEYSINRLSSKPLVLDIYTDSEIDVNVIVEEQEKYPDRGYYSKHLTIPEYFTDKPVEIEMLILVTEDRGRYAGNTAQWKCVLRIEKYE